MTTAGMGEVKVVMGNGAIGCVGLGSCVGVLVVDSVTRTAAVAHVMLPSGRPKAGGPVGKYADAAVPALLDVFGQTEETRMRLRSALIGGAELFPALEHGRSMRIGERNVETAKGLLEAEGISIAVLETGGRDGRSFRFELATGVLTVRAPVGESSEFHLYTAELRAA